MSQEKNSFRHESLQDAKTIEEILNSITKGLAKGKLTFSDENDEMTLEPEGLLHFKLTAERNDNRHKLNIRVSWHVEDKFLKQKKNLTVSTK